MNTDELKKLLKNSTTVLILENGEPSLVILGYDTYKDLISGHSGAEFEVPLRRDSKGAPAQEKVSDGKLADGFRQGRDNAGIPNHTPKAGAVGQAEAFQNRIIEKESELLEKINKQILALKDEIENEEKSADISSVD